MGKPRSLESPDAKITEPEPGERVDFIALAIEQSLIDGAQRRGRDGGRGAPA